MSPHSRSQSSLHTTHFKFFFQSSRKVPRSTKSSFSRKWQSRSFSSRRTTKTSTCSTSFGGLLNISGWAVVVVARSLRRHRYPSSLNVEDFRPRRHQHSDPERGNSESRAIFHAAISELPCQLQKLGFTLRIMPPMRLLIRSRSPIMSIQTNIHAHLFGPP
jgi:hypothetical protein